MKIFDLGLRAPDEIFGRELVEDEVKVEDAEPSSTAEPALEGEAEAADSDVPEPSLDHVDPDHAEQIAASPAILPMAPAFLSRSASIRTPFRGARPIPKPLTALASHFGRFSRILRGHLAEGSANIKTHRGPVGTGGAVVAALSLVALLIGAGLFMGISQIKSLKLEVSALERQLVPLKKQAADADQQGKKNNAEQKNLSQVQPPVPGVTEKGKSSAENEPTPGPTPRLQLSPDEMRLIREYIKPAPFSGPAASPINVGDPVNVATIPLPSPLTDKVPKLLGARFTIRNGAIVIVKRDSHQADAVLAAN